MDRKQIREKESYQNFDKVSSYTEENLSREQSMKLWIKTLLNSYKYFPKLIKTVDKIIEMRASTTSFSTDIFNSSKKNNQIEYIIDMGERKKSLVNIYVMISEFIKILPSDMKEIAEKKFFDKCTNEDLSIELNISLRTIYRKISKIVDKIYEHCVKSNWSLEFIKLQVQQDI